MLFALREFCNVLAEKGTETARQFIPHDKEASRFAVAVLLGREKLRETVKPNHVPESVDSVLLSRTEPTRAIVGWLEPTYDNLPGKNPLVESAGKLFESGIYAHAPSEHEYDLDGEWRHLREMRSSKPNWWNGCFACVRTTKRFFVRRWFSQARLNRMKLILQE